MEEQFDSPVNMCLKQGKKLKVTSRLNKEALQRGNVEFETDFECVDEQQQNG